MQIININKRYFDVFFNDGWTSYARLMKTNHGLVIYKRSNDLPSDFLNTIETKLLIDEIRGLKCVK